MTVEKGLINAEKTGSLNEFGSLPYFTYIKVDSK